MSSYNPSLGLKGGVSAPSAIANKQHHDTTESQKTIAGSPIAIAKVVADSTVATAVSGYTVVRVVNRGTTVAYFWAGPENAPAASALIDQTNGVALPPNSVESFCCPASSDPQKGIMIKASNALVHLVVMAG